MPKYLKIPGTPTLESPTKPVSPTKTPYPHPPGILPIVEEEEGQLGEGEESGEAEGQRDGGREDPREEQLGSEVPSNADEVHDLIHGSSGITSQNAALLSKIHHYPHPNLYKLTRNGRATTNDRYDMKCFEDNIIHLCLPQPNLIRNDVRVAGLCPVPAACFFSSSKH